MASLRPELIGKVAERLRALADETRLRLLLRLRTGECNVKTLCDEVGIAQASVSKHLAVLKRVGLVESRARGPQSIFRVRDGSVFDLCRIVCDGVVRHLQQEQAVLRAAPLVPSRRRRPTRRPRGPGPV